MNKKAIAILIALIAVVAAGNLSAANFLSIGSVNYYDYATLEEGDYDKELHQGIRIEYFLSDYLGISADSIVIRQNDWHQSREMVYTLDAVLRLPLTPLEPYIGVGPTYRGYMDDHDSDVDSTPFAYNVRFGVDVVALSWLSLGIESNFFVSDVPDFFQTLSSSTSNEIADYIKNDSLIGLTAKIRF